MRGLETPIRRIRRQVFTKVAKLAFESTPETLIDDIEAVPYELINEDTEKYRESIYRSRAIVRERMRLAMGMSLRPEDKPVHLTAGIEESNIQINIMSHRLCRLSHLPVRHARKRDMK